MEENREELTVRTLKIVDGEGNLRIKMDGGNETVPAGILIYNSAGHPGLQIFNLPDGRISMSFLSAGVGGRFRGTYLSECGLVVDDNTGCPAVIVGSTPGSDHFALTVFKDGHEILEIPLGFDSGDPDDDLAEGASTDSGTQVQD